MSSGDASHLVLKKRRAAEPAPITIEGNPTRPWVWALALLGVVTLTASASADEQDGVGRARWARTTIVLDYDASMEAISPQAFDALRGAVQAWQDASPHIPKISLRRKDSAMGYQVQGENTNSVTFAKAGDPSAKGALAVTVVTFGGTPKRIVDADIVVNGEHRFSTGEASSAEVYDLQNVLAHEIGHLLGLGEEPRNEQATMYPYSSPRETIKHDLSATDHEALQRHYPPRGPGVVAALRARLQRAVRPREP